jgi:flagellar hook-length control protein FliK
MLHLSLSTILTPPSATGAGPTPASSADFAGALAGVMGTTDSSIASGAATAATAPSPVVRQTGADGGKTLPDGADIGSASADVALPGESADAAFVSTLLGGAVPAATDPASVTSPAPKGAGTPPPMTTAASTGAAIAPTIGKHDAVGASDPSAPWAEAAALASAAAPALSSRGKKADGQPAPVDARERDHPRDNAVLPADASTAIAIPVIVAPVATMVAPTASASRIPSGAGDSAGPATAIGSAGRALSRPIHLSSAGAPLAGSWAPPSNVVLATPAPTGDAAEGRDAAVAIPTGPETPVPVVADAVKTAGAKGEPMRRPEPLARPAIASANTSKPVSLAAPDGAAAIALPTEASPMPPALASDATVRVTIAPPSASFDAAASAPLLATTAAVATASPGSFEVAANGAAAALLGAATPVAPAGIVAGGRSEQSIAMLAGQPVSQVAPTLNQPGSPVMATSAPASPAAVDISMAAPMANASPVPTAPAVAQRSTLGDVASSASSDRVSTPSAPAAAPATVAPLPAPSPIRTAGMMFGFALGSPLSVDRRTSDPASPRDAALQALTAAAGTVMVAGGIADPTGAQQGALDMNRGDWPQAMIDRIDALRDAANANDTSIRLMPDALGKVDVSIRHDGNQVHVHFAAEAAVTRQMIADAQPRLVEAAQARGMRLGQTTVDGGNAGTGQQQTQHGGGAAQPRVPIRPGRARTTAADDTTPSDSTRLA